MNKVVDFPIPPAFQPGPQTILFFEGCSGVPSFQLGLFFSSIISFANRGLLKSTIDFYFLRSKRSKRGLGVANMGPWLEGGRDGVMQAFQLFFAKHRYAVLNMRNKAQLEARDPKRRQGTANMGPWLEGGRDGVMQAFQLFFAKQLKQLKQLKQMKQLKQWNMYG